MSEKFVPNWASKHTRNRLLQIQSFAEDYFTWNDSIRRLHSDVRKIHFGQSQNELSKYFIDLLLSPTSGYKPNLKSYEYKFSWNNLLWAFNQAGLATNEEIEEAGIKTPVVCVGERGLCLLVFGDNETKAKQFFDKRYLERNCADLLHQNATYEVDEFTTRFTNKFQNISKTLRAKFWSGWYDYDIEACAYTLFYQHMVNVVNPWWGGKQESYPVIEKVFTDRTEFRAKLSEELDVDVPMVKEVLAAVLFDAKLVNNHRASIYKKLVKRGYNPVSFFRRVEKCALLKALIAELRRAWPKAMSYWNNQNDRSGRKAFTREKIDKETGEITKSRFNAARFRSRIYFELERKVIDACVEFNSGKICHLMHDGFFMKERVDLNSLIPFIFERTGFKVKISEKIL